MFTKFIKRTKQKQAWKLLESLYGELSSENLTCNSMLSRRQIYARMARITAEWKSAEKIIGRRVKINEVKRKMISQYS